MIHSQVSPQNTKCYHLANIHIQHGTTDTPQNYYMHNTDSEGGECIACRKI